MPDKEWYLPSRFQIISAGRDKMYGEAPWPPDDTPGPFYTQNLDNLTNFCDGRLQTLLK